MYHMIGCPCVSRASFMIKTAKRWPGEKKKKRKKDSEKATIYMSNN